MLSRIWAHEAWKRASSSSSRLSVSTCSTPARPMMHGSEVKIPSSPYWPRMSVEAPITECSSCSTAATMRAAALATAYSVHPFPASVT